MDWVFYLREASIEILPIAIDEDTPITYNGKNELFIDGSKQTKANTTKVTNRAKELFAANPPSNGDLQLQFQIKQYTKELIYAVVDEDTQANLSALAGVDMLPEPDLTTYKAGLGWIGATIAFSRSLRNTTPVPTDYKKANWPPATQAMKDLGEAY